MSLTYTHLYGITTPIHKFLCTRHVIILITDILDQTHIGSVSMGICTNADYTIVYDA